METLPRRSTETEAMNKLNLLIVAILCGCHSAESAPLSPPPLPARPPAERTCLVLSVGGPSGVAHLGAIEAVRSAGITIDCVAGNSMGALVGGLYASAPEANTTKRYLAFARAYVAASKDATANGGAVGALTGLMLAGATGGAALPLFAGGGLAGASSVAEADHGRMVGTLHNAYSGMNVEDAKLRYGFATYFLRIGATGIAIERVGTGRMADAVGKSIANPLIFPGIDPKRTGVLDPGVDRVSSTPLDDTCAGLPHDEGPSGTHFTLLAINVSGRPAYYGDRRCRVVEVMVDPGSVSAKAMFFFGPDYERALAVGYRETCRAIASQQLGTCRAFERNAPPVGAIKYTLSIESASIEPTKADGRPWDAGENGPDPYVLVTMAGVGSGHLRVPAVRDTLTPTWLASGPLEIAYGDVVTLRVADSDLINDDPIASLDHLFDGPGQWQRGVPGTPLRSMRYSVRLPR